jgi:hypothetical protein
MKPKPISEAQFLSLLEKALSIAVKDPHLSSAIYEAVAKEIRLVNILQSFEKFCEKGALPDLQPETLTGLQVELADKFGDQNVSIIPEEKGDAVAVEIALPDRTVTAKVKVQSPEEAAAEMDGEAKVPFVPFPVALPEDPELVWVLARREDFAPDEAARALTKIEEEFWQTKAGQKLLKERVQRSFAEFIANVPAAMLLESGLKRHYKEPEPLKTLRLLKENLPSNDHSEITV